MEVIEQLPDKKLLKSGLYILYAAAAAALCWIVIRFALPCILPFLFALLTAKLIQPPIDKLCERLRFRRGFSSAVCSFAVLAAIFAVSVFLAYRIIVEISSLVKELPSVLSASGAAADAIKEKIYTFIVAAPVGIQDHLRNAVDSILAKSSELPAALSGKLLGVISQAAAAAPKAVLFVVTYAVGVFFISAGYGEITAFLGRQLPDGAARTVREIVGMLRGTFGKWVKAQLMLCGITFLELSAAFLLMRVDHAIVIAFAAALIDALPVLGTGVVLVPWAVVSLVAGSAVRAASLMITYVVCVVVRNCLEPKFVGSQLGLHPAAALASMYFSFKALGVAGMLTFPIALITLKQLNDRGFIKLWK